MVTSLKNTLQRRKKRIEERLKKHGVTTFEISFLRYLMFDEKEFASPYEVGCRIMILYAVASSVEMPEKWPAFVVWFKEQNVWDHVVEREKELFAGNIDEEDELDAFSWQGEAAYVLAWALGLVRDRPDPSGQLTEEQVMDLVNHLPATGDNLQAFLSELSYRDAEEIFEENIFYELTTAYFRDLLFNGQEDSSDIERTAAFQRHKALNWLRRFSGIKEWDETSTST